MRERPPKMLLHQLSKSISSSEAILNNRYFNLFKFTILCNRNTYYNLNYFLSLHLILYGTCRPMQNGCEEASSSGDCIAKFVFQQAKCRRRQLASTYDHYRYDHSDYQHVHHDITRAWTHHRPRQRHRRLRRRRVLLRITIMAF